jgi:hypothetical protein
MICLKRFILLLALVLVTNSKLCAQIKPNNDTFFLVQKKGWLRKLGESIYITADDGAEPIKSVNPFEKYKGKIIRNITIAPTGFYTIVHDTVNGRKHNFGEGVQDFFHKNTLEKVIKKNLFFKQNDKLLPLMLSDNERFLREQPYLQGALIKVIEDTNFVNIVDVVILTRDVFSIGASVDVANTKKAEPRMQEENLFGTGNKLEIAGLYDYDRNPRFGVGAFYQIRNFKGSFLNWTSGFKMYNTAFNSGRPEESTFYTNFDKPLNTRYNAWMGNASFSYNVSKNLYPEISSQSFKDDYKYKIISVDIWAGLNIGYKSNKETDNEKRLRHFVAVRTFYNNFYEVPDRFKENYNPSYADLSGALVSYTLYRQNFYKTNFIYGFGRKEDIAKGLSATLITGYTVKEGIKRTYNGFEFEGTTLYNKGRFLDFTLKVGSYLNQKKLEDGLILAGINGFTNLKKINKYWRNRSFYGINYTRQFNSKLGFPLVLETESGLPYYNNVGIAADTRTVIKFESVFYNLKKFFGFRFAPFIFSDLGLIKPLDQPTNQSIGFTALGGGVRTRNENLVFGTVELKGYYFPRINEGIKNWKIELATKINFRIKSNFIRRPDFVNGN